MHDKMAAKPWESESDHVDFSHAGYPCILHRNTLGAWCGYVGVPPGHPAHGKGYDEVSVSVHGGLTYASRCQGPICHEAKPGDAVDVWWLGFDCLHLGDLCPKSLELAEKLPGYPPPLKSDVYRDENYVRVETQELAEQLAEMAHGRA